MGREGRWLVEQVGKDRTSHLSLCSCSEVPSVTPPRPPPLACAPGTPTLSAPWNKRRSLTPWLLARRTLAFVLQRGEAKPQGLTLKGVHTRRGSHAKVHVGPAGEQLPGSASQHNASLPSPGLAPTAPCHPAPLVLAPKRQVLHALDACHACTRHPALLKRSEHRLCFRRLRTPPRLFGSGYARCLQRCRRCRRFGLGKVLRGCGCFSCGPAWQASTSAGTGPAAAGCAAACHSRRPAPVHALDGMLQGLYVRCRDGGRGEASSRCATDKGGMGAAKHAGSAGMLLHPSRGRPSLPQPTWSTSPSHASRAATASSSLSW